MERLFFITLAVFLGRRALDGDDGEEDALPHGGQLAALAHPPAEPFVSCHIIIVASEMLKSSLKNKRIFCICNKLMHSNKVKESKIFSGLQYKANPAIFHNKNKYAFRLQKKYGNLPV